MIAERNRPLEWVVRLAAPLVWRSQRRMARKLQGFAATEAGSALDMLKAAELTPDPELRRLFFRHAMDEARHAELFGAAARGLDPDPIQRGSEYHLIHATRQNLFERLGPVRFMAFVHLAEKSGESQFRALEEHFAGEELGALFGKIGRDERFHVRYSGRILERWQKAGQAREVARARRRVRIDRVWQMWRRSGRILGDLLTRTVLTLVYLVALPVFVLFQRRLDPERPGWKVPRRKMDSFDDARRSF